MTDCPVPRPAVQTAKAKTAGEPHKDRWLQRTRPLVHARRLSHPHGLQRCCSSLQLDSQFNAVVAGCIERSANDFPCCNGSFRNLRRVLCSRGQLFDSGEKRWCCVCREKRQVRFKMLFRLHASLVDFSVATARGARSFGSFR